MILYANGCSMTYGSELVDDPVTGCCTDDRQRWRQAWPGWLGRALGADRVVNDAVPSGSNDRVVRTTVGWCARMLGLGTAPAGLFVVVGWTSALRREFYVAGAYRQLVPHHRYALPELDRLAAAYRETAWSESESISRFVTQVVTLQSFLDMQGIPHLFFDALSGIGEDLLHAAPAAVQTAQLIDRDRYFGFGPPAVTLVDRLRAEVPQWNGQHPSAEGHRVWAAHLFHFSASRDIVSAGRPGAAAGPAENEPEYDGTSRVLVFDRKAGFPRRPTGPRRGSETELRPSSGLAARLRAARRQDPFLYP